MGIPGLFGFLEYYDKNTQLKKLIAGKRIGCDIFWFMHRCKGDINVLKSSLAPFFENSELCYFVFDGKVPEDKKDEKAAQHSKREKINNDIMMIESQTLENINKKDREYLLAKIEQMKRDNWTPRGEFIENIKTECEKWHKNIRLEIAEFEADTWLVSMENKGQIDYIVSNDSDLIINGCNHLIRPKIIKGLVKYYDVSDIMLLIRCNKTEWNELCELFKKYKGNDIIEVYSWWRYYRHAEIIYSLFYNKFNIPKNNHQKSVSPSKRRYTEINTSPIRISNGAKLNQGENIQNTVFCYK